MKFLDVIWGWSAVELIEKFLEAFLEDIRKVFDARNFKLDEWVIVKIFMGVNRLLGRARGDGYANKKILANIIRIELEVLDGKKIKLLFIPLDDQKNPILEKEKCPYMIFPIDQEDIKRESGKGKKFKFTADGENEIGLN